MNLEDRLWQRVLNGELTEDQAREQLFEYYDNQAQFERERHLYARPIQDNTRHPTQDSGE